MLLSPQKIKQITSTITNGSNFLIFGTGHDSDYWRSINSNGHNLFLEDDDKWIPKNNTDILHIQYRQNCNDYQKIFNDKKFDDLNNVIYKYIKYIRWNYILVDGPKGWLNSTNHGRMESIYLAYNCSDQDTIIFIDDIERPIEKLYGNYFFNIVEIVDNLAICKKKSLT